MTMNTSEKVRLESEPGLETSRSDDYIQQPAGSMLSSPLYPLAAKEAIRVAVSTNAPVIIAGEGGTRKRGLARAIHREGLQKRSGLFVVKAEQFEEDIRRLLEEGRGLKGTLLIRRIDRLSEAMQAVLEDYLDSGELALDGISSQAALRLIMTSEIDSGAMAAESLVERTLLHRLSIVRLDLPPLRSRKQDIPSIAGYLRDRICRNYVLPEKEISPQALDYLARYSWPDNLDELEGVIARGLAACTETMVMPWHLSLPSGVEDTAPQDCGEPLSSMEEEKVDPKIAREAATEATPEARVDLSLSVALQLAHEIKNPLVSIKTYTNLLKDKFGDEEFRSEFYQVMTNDVEKIDRVVEEILAAARVQGDSSDCDAPEIEHVDVNEMIDSLLGEFRDKLAGRKIAVFRFLGDDIPAVPIENAQSREAIGGLLMSIIDHISDNGDIYISTARKTLGGEDVGHAVEITLEGNPFAGDLVRLGTDIVWQQKILKSQGGRVELKELDGGGVSVTILLRLSRN